MSSELNSKEISGTIQRFFLLEINILAAHALSKSKMISRRQGGGDPTCAGQTSGVYVYTLSKPMTPQAYPGIRDCVVMSPAGGGRGGGGMG